MINVESSWGNLTLNEEGVVIEKDLLEQDSDGERCYLLDAVKFDLAEYDRFYENRFGEPSPKPDDFDVLDLGFWTKNGEYHEPAHDWREEMYMTKEQFDGQEEI